MKKLILIFILTSALAFSQQEASVWYFGQNAGLKFQTNGTVTPLSDGQLNTEEGCSSIADANGNLLFYTDGRTVWDRNHIQMPNGSFANGTELFGDASSTQSAIIVPKPGNSDQYYIFTVDEPHHENAAVYPNAFSGTYAAASSGQVPAQDDGKNNGFNYSLVDLTIIGSNGSVGDIVSRNNHLVTYDPNPTGEEIKYKCSEKITAIKNESDNSYWVITQFINKFYAFKVTVAGVISAPIISAVGSNQTLLGYRSNAIGYLKASPDGTKLAIAHQQNGTTIGSVDFSSGSVELFNLDGNTGVVSNTNTLISNVMAYGVEFSPDSEKLYATYRNGTTSNMELVQFDLTSSNIPNSKVVIYNQYSYIEALQLAPDNKIYCATSYLGTLGVINNPDSNGIACNYVQTGQALASGKIVRFGLPPFITSFFNASFNAENLCFGSNTQFTLTASQNVTNVDWDFGDSSPISHALNPTHQYLAAGNYQVTVVITGVTGTVSKSKTITISANPVVASTVANQSVCGQQSMSFNLSQFNTIVLGTQSLTTFGVAYFTSMANAMNHVNALPVNSTLQSGTQTFYVKVYNLVNIACYSITSFTVTLYIQPTATAPSSNFICDDSSNDGIAIFNLNSNSAAILGSQSSSQYTVSYHLNQSDADTDSNPLFSNYQNISNPQTIFARVQNNQNASCFSTTSFQIGLYAMPIVASQPSDLYVCDAANDNTEIFDLSQQTPVILGSQASSSYTITYHTNLAEANTGSNAISFNYTNTSNPQTIYARIENNSSPACFAITSFQLQVKASPVLLMDDIYTNCEGNIATISAPLGFSSYNWSNGSTTSTTSIATAGNYSLTVTSNYGTISCPTTKNFTVYNSNKATITTIETHDWTDNQNMIIVQLSSDGKGDYEYSLDGIHYQDSNVFEGLRSGQYTVYVNDKKGCGEVTAEVFLLMYPKFFTPNGDGINDVWRVKFSDTEPNMELEIFDRYGKLITIFKGLDFGWDGTFNGKTEFADDYWFVVKRQNGKEFMGHFSLKR